MKKNLAELRLFNVVDVLNRIARELRRLGSRSAEELASLIDLLVTAGCRMAPVVAFVDKLNHEENDENGESWCSAEHFVRKDGTGVAFEDQYGASAMLRVISGNIELYFNTVGGHGLAIDLIGDTEISVTADGLVSSRFWADDDDHGDGLTWNADTQRLRPLEDGEAPARVVANRESAFLKALAVDDQEFADREAEARLTEKAEFEKRRAEKSVFPSYETSRRVAAAKAAAAAIEAKNAKAALAAAFADNDEV